MSTKGKVWKKVVLVIFLLLLIGTSGVGGYLYYLRNDGLFMKKTILNGYDVSEQSPDDVLKLIVRDFDKIQVTLTEQDEVDFQCTVKELGFHVEEDAVRDLLIQAMDMQNATLKDMAISLIHGLTFKVDIPSSVDEEIFTSKVCAEALAVERVPSKKAKLVQKDDGTYGIRKEVYGNEFADEDLQYEVRTQIGAALSDVSGGKSAFTKGSIDLTFPEELYIQPTLLSTDPDLNTKKDAYNKYCLANITYEYGNKQEVLDWETVKDWVIIDANGGRIDKDLAWAYVSDIAARYNTRYHERTFTTTAGKKITFSSGKNEYGYTVNEDGEFAQLMADLESNTAVSREPVYYKTNSYDNPLYYKRNGKDDLAGTYVEINLSAQHLWLYKNGNLIIESDLVSGCVAKKHETATGVFPLAYKKSPDVLVGNNANDGYRTKVEYWMPFYEGQGLHDATWRGSFGGSIYKNNGSHGCVNLPLKTAATIYENIVPGMAIIIYK